MKKGREVAFASNGGGARAMMSLFGAFSGLGFNDAIKKTTIVSTVSGSS